MCAIHKTKNMRDREYITCTSTCIHATHSHHTRTYRNKRMDGYINMLLNIYTNDGKQHVRTIGWRIELYLHLCISASLLLSQRSALSTRCVCICQYLHSKQTAHCYTWEFALVLFYLSNWILCLEFIGAKENTVVMMRANTALCVCFKYGEFVTLWIVWWFSLFSSQTINIQINFNFVGNFCAKRLLCMDFIFLMNEMMMSFY